LIFFNSEKNHREIIFSKKLKCKRTRRLGKVKSLVRAIFMKLCILHLFLTRDQIEQVSGPEKGPLGGRIGAQGSIRSKIDSRRKVPLWKAYGFGDRPTSTSARDRQNKCNLKSNDCRRGTLRRLSIFDCIDFWPTIRPPTGHFPDLKPVTFDFWLKIGLMCKISWK
jgi:hypothetical protein